MCLCFCFLCDVGSLYLHRNKGIDSMATRCMWFTQTFLFGFASLGLLLKFDPERRKQHWGRPGWRLQRHSWIQTMSHVPFFLLLFLYEWCAYWDTRTELPPSYSLTPIRRNTCMHFDGPFTFPAFSGLSLLQSISFCNIPRCQILKVLMNYGDSALSNVDNTLGVIFWHCIFFLQFTHFVMFWSWLVLDVKNFNSCHT